MRSAQKRDPRDTQRGLRAFSFDPTHRSFPNRVPAFRPAGSLPLHRLHVQRNARRGSRRLRAAFYYGRNGSLRTLNRICVRKVQIHRRRWFSCSCFRDAGSSFRPSPEKPEKTDSGKQISAEPSTAVLCRYLLPPASSHRFLKRYPTPRMVSMKRGRVA